MTTPFPRAATCATVLLEGTDAKIGGNTNFSATLPPDSTAVLLAGFPANAPLLFPELVSYIDVADSIFVIGAQVVGKAGFQQTVPIPDIASLKGLEFMFQIAGLDRGSLFATNGVWLILDF